MTDAPTISLLAIAAVIAYFLGSLPAAYLAGKLYGKDIFNVGSRQAGATNVWREVSRTAGISVFLVDSAKGLTAIVVARWLGVEGAPLMLPSSAVILGHWNSPFTRFRGGDGVSSLTGVVLGINPITALPAYLIVAFVTLRFNARLEHPTLWGATFGYLTYMVAALTPIAPVEPVVVFGITGLGLAILLHSMVYHHRRMSVQQEPIQAPEEPTERLLS